MARPQDPSEQTDYYSGKKKRHTVKNNLLVNRLARILFLSDTVEGRMHDKALAESTPYALPAESELVQDLGFLGFSLNGVIITMAHKKPKGKLLTEEQVVSLLCVDTFWDNHSHQQFFNSPDMVGESGRHGW